MCNYCCNNSTYCSRCNNNYDHCSCGWYKNDCHTRQHIILPQVVTQPYANTRSIGYFNNTAAVGIAAGSPIPVFLNNNQGVGVIGNSTSAVVQPGVYRVSYSVTGTNPTAAGVVGVGISVNGVNQPMLTESQTITAAGDLADISGEGIINVTAPNSTIGLVNTSTAGTVNDYTNANLIVERVG